MFCSAVHASCVCRWTVGLLSEMPPEGKVGVSPVCILVRGCSHAVHPFQACRGFTAGLGEGVGAATVMKVTTAAHTEASAHMVGRA